MTALTTRLSGLLRRMKPSRPVTVTAAKDGAGETERRGRAADGERPDQAERVITSLEKLTQEPADQPKPARRTGLLSRISGSARREERMDHLQEGYNDVVELMHSVRDRLDEQSDRSDQLMQILARLPEAIDALPETNRNQARMLEALQTHLDRQDRQATTLNKSLGDLATATEHQGQVMSVIQRQIEMNHKIDQEMLKGFGAMGTTLERLNDASQFSNETLQKVTEQSKTADENLRKLMKTSTRNMTLLSVASWAMALAAMGAAIYAGWAITSMGG